MHGRGKTLRKTSGATAAKVNLHKPDDYAQKPQKPQKP